MQCIKNRPEDLFTQKENKRRIRQWSIGHESVACRLPIAVQCTQKSHVLNNY